ncbi:MAG: CocE/NonD family hydrolase [Chloroflexota bacterium]|nr:CocE/NonD family hydrolase [Chloroflexota bacterium]
MATVLIDKNVMVPMRDGVRLVTDVYRLDGAAPAPVLLARTPYDKERAMASTGVPFDILRVVQDGYAVVTQDVRGRYASEGAFAPMFQETRDGVDTIAWAAAEPWSRGVVGTFGGSYVGCTQWLPAREHPPALRAMAPAVTFSDMYEGNTYQGGAKVLHDLRWVVANIIPGEIRRRVMRGGKPPEGAASLDVNAVLADLPLADHPLIHDLAPF